MGKSRNKKRKGQGEANKGKAAQEKIPIPQKPQAIKTAAAVAFTGTTRPHEIVLKVVLAIKAPVISASTSAGAHGIDVPFARTIKGTPYIPGSQVKGRLREAMAMLVENKFLSISEDQIALLFGAESVESAAQSNAPRRGTIRCTNFHAVAPQGDGVQTRIAMDPMRGAVKKGAYLVIESPFDPGKKVHFKGMIHFVSIDRENMIASVKAALRWIPSFGANKSVGFGQVIEVSIKEETGASQVPSQVSEDPAAASGEPENNGHQCLQLELVPSLPFCISRPHADDNLFQSETVIPGSVVKGCIANTLNHLAGRSLDTPIDDSIGAPWTALGRHFEKIRCLHAFPAPAEPSTNPRNITAKVRPSQYPLSLVRAAGRTFDIALCANPGLVLGQAPIFSVDWKQDDYKAVEKEMGWTGWIPTHLRVRTAISGKLRRAEESQLFAMETIVPTGHAWHSRIDLHAIQDPKERAAVASALSALFQGGLKYLGKTKVDVRVTPTFPRKGEGEPVVQPLSSGLYVVVLQSPTLMIDPKWTSTKVSGGTFNDARVDLELLKEAYTGYWREASGNKLDLIRFFARQRLLGGYLHYRFQTGKPYNPFFVTSEQSVFVLELSSKASLKDISPLLTKWMTHGLDLPKWAHTAYADPLSPNSSQATYRTCPFVPENGFGEIAINMPCHLEKKPKEDEFKEVKHG